MTETWRPVVGYEGRYEVSDHGRVRSLSHKGFTRKKQYVMIPSADAKGYLRIVLVRDGSSKQVRRSIHRLVLQAFVGPCPEGLQAAHGDGNPANNLLSNLRWATPQENHRDKYRHGTATIGERHPRSKLTVAAVLEIRRRYRRGINQNVLGNARELAKEFGVDRTVIQNIVAGRRWIAALADLRALTGRK